MTFRLAARAHSGLVRVVISHVVLIGSSQFPCTDIIRHTYACLLNILPHVVEFKSGSDKNVLMSEQLQSMFKFSYASLFLFLFEVTLPSIPSFTEVCDLPPLQSSDKVSVTLPPLLLMILLHLDWVSTRHTAPLSYSDHTSDWTQEQHEMNPMICFSLSLSLSLSLSGSWEWLP